MMKFLRKILRSFLFKDTWVKLSVNTYHNILQRGQFRFDNFRMDFYDTETGRRYVMRPVGNPLPHIVDELVKITGDLKSATNVYAKFTQACANVSKHKEVAFKAKVLKDT